jgi:sugar/nucleoside kinase (ribokinase family)
MVTHLGIAQNLCVDDLNLDLLALGKFLYVEGYLWDSPASRDAAIHAINYVLSCRNQTVLALSDADCVARHRFDFLALAHRDIDYVFGNEAEWMMLFHTTTADELRQLCQTIHGTAIITRSEKEAWIISNGHIFDVPAIAPTALVDTTGAGDLYVSGFLYGVLRGYSLPLCGQLGSVAAAEVISHMGARPLESLRRVMTAYDIHSTRNKENVYAS